MIFDRACKVIERQLPQMVPVFEAAALFYLDKPAEVIEHAKRNLDDAETAELMNQTFFLPFPVTAIEDAVSLIILMDTEEGAQGLVPRRRFVEVMALDLESAERAEDTISSITPEKSNPHLLSDLKAAGAGLPPGAMAITWGVTSLTAGMGVLTPGRRGWELEGSLAGLTVATPDRTVHRERQSVPPDIHNATLKNVVTAYEQVQFFNTPSRFVVESAPAKTRRCPKGRVRRSHDRSRYTLLTPEQITKRFGLGGKRGTHRTPTPHRRRRHYRRLTSERYKAARGKVIMVEATWVGDTERREGNRVYRVRTEL